MQKLLLNISLAVEGVMANKLRAILTALGILFGVAAVITMLAIGTGAKLIILEQMKLIGSNTIVIKSLQEVEEDDSEVEQGDSDSDKRPYTPGLTLGDVWNIKETVPHVEAISPEIVINTSMIHSGIMIRSNCIGVTNELFEMNGMRLESGNYFHELHMEDGRPVCIIGKKIQTRLFKGADPIGKKIKCGQNWLKVIGVLEDRTASKEQLEELGIRDVNADVYVPITTALLRFENRARITSRDVGSRRENAPVVNYHQIDQMYVQVDETRHLQSVADVIAKTLKRRHKEVIDFEVDVPEKAIEAQQKTQETFNSVLAFIAGISLLVGGIGIMNIMLASVLERIKEIGIRRSLGATKKDIILQFLFEAIIISLLGGVLGVILGVVASKLISTAYDIPAEVTAWSMVLSFVVATSIGLIFGIVPAQNAAKHDPIKALRTD